MASPAAFPVTAPLADGWLDRGLALALGSGGDERLWLEAETGRNRYGAPLAPADDEIWFASSTASPISRRGQSAARVAFTGLFHGDHSPMTLTDAVRARLLALYGAPGADVVLTASGTEAEFIVLALARAILGQRPIRNLVVAPAETGSGVPVAADGRHFLDHSPLGGLVPRGARLAGWEAADIAVQPIDIRRPCGALRPAGEIDAEVEQRNRDAQAAGYAVLAHALDCSKTGHAGVSAAAAHRLTASGALVVVDACQLRCDAAQVRAHLAAGVAVMITGSKFAGGPAFSGALLLPATWIDRLGPTPLLPKGLAAYSARLDWPAALRGAVAATLDWPSNLGLALRWTAALAEIEAFEATDPDVRRLILDAFAEATRARIAFAPGLQPLAGPVGTAGSIRAVDLRRGTDATRDVWRRLQAGACHLGQPVAVGQGAVLRVCASMPLVTAIAERLPAGYPLAGAALAKAMAPVEADLDHVFARLTLALKDTV